MLPTFFYSKFFFSYSFQFIVDFGSLARIHVAQRTTSSREKTQLYFCISHSYFEYTTTVYFGFTKKRKKNADDIVKYASTSSKNTKTKTKLPMVIYNFVHVTLHIAGYCVWLLDCMCACECTIRMIFVNKE